MVCDVGWVVTLAAVHAGTYVPVTVVVLLSAPVMNPLAGDPEEKL